MAKFGTADLGLIKAVAGAEQSMAIDEGLMIGQAVGGLINKMATQQAVKNKALAKQTNDLNKAFSESYQMPDGSLDPQMEDMLRGKIQGFKQVFINNQGGSFENQRALAKNEREYKKLVNSLDTAQNALDINRTALYEPNGFDKDDARTQAQLKNGQFQVGLRANKANNENELYFAVPINHYEAPKGLTEKEIEQFREIDGIKLEDRTPKQKELHGVYSQQSLTFNEDLKEYNRIDALDDFIVTPQGDKVHNPEKYNRYNSNEISTFGNVDVSRTNMLQYNNTELAPLDDKNTKDGVIVKTAADFEIEIYNRMTKGNPDAKQNEDNGAVNTRTELNDILFSDGSPNDNATINIAYNQDGSVNTENPNNVDNTYANYFIHEITDQQDGSKHSYMYKDSDGEPLKWKKDDETLVYGTAKWEDTPKAERVELLEMKLRGKGDVSNIEQGVSSFNEHQIKQYSKFMGIVMNEEKAMQKRSYYEKSGLYFDDGKTDPYFAADNTTLSKKEKNNLVYTKKADTYVNSIVDLAFGSNESDMVFKNNISSRENIGRIEKILKKEFKAAGMNLDVKSPYQSIEINGETFDFKDPETARETLIELKEYLKGTSVEEGKVNPFDPLSSFIDSKPNSVDDWKQEFKDKKDQYYPGIYQEAFNSRANLPLDEDGKIITSTD